MPGCTSFNSTERIFPKDPVANLQTQQTHWLSLSSKPKVSAWPQLPGSWAWLNPRCNAIGEMRNPRLDSRPLVAKRWLSILMEDKGRAYRSQHSCNCGNNYSVRVLNVMPTPEPKTQSNPASMSNPEEVCKQVAVKTYCRYGAQPIGRYGLSFPPTLFLVPDHTQRTLICRPRLDGSRSPAKQDGSLFTKLAQLPRPPLPYHLTASRRHIAHHLNSKPTRACCRNASSA